VFEKLVEIRQLELPSYSVRDANPLSQFVEAVRFGDSDNRGSFGELRGSRYPSKRVL
jgi:hypothetical protein